MEFVCCSECENIIGILSKLHGFIPEKKCNEIAEANYEDLTEFDANKQVTPSCL